MKKYLVRLDDACPTMDSKKWDRVEDILDQFDVKPMIGVIPANADPKQLIDKTDTEFWQKVKKWKSKGWAIALHGYDHCYISDDRGINPLWPRSEFAGVSLDIQKEKIRNGVKILKSHGINPKYFFAPSHTFDENTLLALKDETDIRIISDTIATRPYRKNDFIFIPQLGGSCRKIPIPGVYTFCLHPSAMNELDFENLTNFLMINKLLMTSFDALQLDNLKSKNLFSRLLSSGYFFIRKLRGL